MPNFFLRRQAFDPSCPSGGSWFACSTGANFVGCCQSTDACFHGCSAGNLKPASFDPAYYGQFQDQECPTGSEWYTCTATNPPFMGCCKTNPCTGTTGCPSGDLAAGFLSSNPKVAVDFLPSGSALPSTSSTSSSSSTFTTSSSTSSTSSRSTSSSSSSATFSSASSPFASHSTTAIAISPSASGPTSAASTLATTKAPASTNAPTSHQSTGTIAGSTVGGIAGLVLGFMLLAFLVRRKTLLSRHHMNSSRASTWGAGKEVAGQGVQMGQVVASEGPKDHSFTTPSPTSPAPMYTPYTPELGTSDAPAQRLTMKTHHSYEMDSPASYMPSPASSPPPTFNASAYQQQFQPPGNYSDGGVYHH